MRKGMMSYVARVLEPIKADTPSDVGQLAQSLREYAYALELYQDTMPNVEPHRCTTCGRYWLAEGQTYGEARRSRPDDCPECFNATHGNTSYWTPRYVPADEEMP